MEEQQKSLETGHRELTNKVDGIDKRLDDFKWSITLFSSAVAVIGFIFSVIFGFNIHADRQVIRELSADVKKEVETLKHDVKEDIKEKLGKTEKLPQLQVNMSRDCALQDQELLCKVVEDPKHPGKFKVQVPIIVQNIGKSNSGPLFIKIYINKPLKVEIESSDESGYNYESYFYNLNPPQVPVGISIGYRLNIQNVGFEPEANLELGGKVPALVKITYGNDLVLRVPFTMVYRQMKKEEGK